MVEALEYWTSSPGKVERLGNWFDNIYDGDLRLGMRFDELITLRY
jgi:hypothetical protein